MTVINGLQTCADDNYSAIVMIICMAPGDIVHIVDSITLLPCPRKLNIDSETRYSLDKHQKLC